LRPDVHADVIFLEDVQASKRPEGLADGQGGNADEADEVRQGKILDLSLRGAGEGAGAKAPRLLRGFHAAPTGRRIFSRMVSQGCAALYPGLFSVLPPGDGALAWGSCDRRQSLLPCETFLVAIL